MEIYSAIPELLPAADGDRYEESNNEFLQLFDVCP
jgi:hypothetical protein